MWIMPNKLGKFTHYKHESRQQKDITVIEFIAAAPTSSTISIQTTNILTISLLEPSRSLTWPRQPN